MEKWLPFLHSHAPHAHWVIFGAALLAGLNVPISIDLLMIVSAILAATIIPAHTFKLFLAIYLGCMISAWLAYWLGRTVGRRLIQLPLFSKILSPARIQKIHTFYQKRGPYAFLIGRFIPLGVRNGLYMTSGMSRTPFWHFAFWEGLACTVWSGVCFALYYTLGKNIETLYARVKFVNLLIFFSFGVTVIAAIWYKKRKKESNV